MGWEAVREGRLGEQSEKTERVEAVLTGSSHLYLTLPRLSQMGLQGGSLTPLRVRPTWYLQGYSGPRTYSCVVNRK